MITLEQVLAACRVRYPMIQVGLSRLTFVERPGLGTVGVDQYWRLYYDPAAFERWGLAHSATVIVGHELMGHLARNHASRAKSIGADRRRWNIGADEEINDDWPEDALPAEAVRPAKLEHPDGLLAEQYYTLLGASEQAPEQPRPGAQQGHDSSDSVGSEEATGRDPGTSASEGSDAAQPAEPAATGQAAGINSGANSPSVTGEGDGTDTGATGAPGHGSDSTEGAEQSGSAGGEGGSSPAASDSSPRSGHDSAVSHASSDASHPEQGTGDSGSAAGPGSGDCSGASGYEHDDHSHEAGCCAGGSGVTGVPSEWEAPAPGEPGAPPGLLPAEADRARQELAESVRRYAHSNPSRGNMPGSWVCWADEMAPKPKPVAWQALLRRELGRNDVRRRGRQDYSYALPSRRQFGRDVLMPACIERPPTVVVVVDTSGSRSDAELSADAADVTQICRVLGMQVQFLAVDAVVQSVGKAWSKRDVTRRLKGGGGTDMRIGIAEAERLRADVCVVLTDGYTPWPDAPPRCQTIVVSTGNRGPKWARNFERKA